MGNEEEQWDEGNQGEHIDWDPETYGQQTDGQEVGAGWQDPNTEQAADWSDGGGSGEQGEQEIPLSPDEHIRVLNDTYNNFPQQYGLWADAMREALGEKFDSWENGLNLEDEEVVTYLPDPGAELTRILATDPACQVAGDPLAGLYQRLHEGLQDFQGGRVYTQKLIDIIIHTQLVPLTVANCENLKLQMDEAFKGSEIETIFITNIATELAALNNPEGNEEPLQLEPVQRQPIVAEKRRDHVAVIRSDWLFENARIARFYFRHCGGGNSFYRFMSEVGIGPGFRIYITLWLFCATVMGCCLGWHLQFTILIDLFLPAESKYMVSVGYFAMFLLSIIFMGSYITALERIWTGWIYFDDETYFGDEDFAKRCREKGGAPRSKTKYNNAQEAYKVCPHLLPPFYKRTFLNLPTGWMRREAWMTLAVLLTTTCPFLYAIINGISQKENIVTMIGHYVTWNICTVFCFTIVYWAYTSYFAYRKKYGAIRRTRQAHKENKEAGTTTAEFDDGNHSWYNDTDVLAEFGLNERSITENLLVMVTSLVALVFFWIASYDKFHSEVSAEWIITSGLIAIIMLAVRETWRSESIRDMVPVVMLVLIVIFFSIGLAGAIEMKGGGVCVYIILVLGSQMMMLRHRVEDEVPNIQIALTFLRKAFHLLTLGIRDEAERTSSKIQGLEEIVNLVSNARAEPTAQTPRGKMARHLQQKLTISTKEAKKLHRAGQPQRDESYIPLGGVMKMLFMPCLWKCCSNRYEVDDMDIDEDEQVAHGLDDAAKKKRMKEIERARRLKRKRLQLEKEDRYGYWRLPRSYWGDDIAQSQEVYQKFKYEPTDKLIQTISPKLSCWYMLVFLIISVLGIAVVGEGLHGDLSPGTSDVGPATAGLLDYPICRMRFPFLPSGISLTDVAVLADISGTNDPDTYIPEGQLLTWFYGEDEMVIIPFRQCRPDDPRDCNGVPEEIPFHHYLHSPSGTNFIVFRSPKKSQQVMTSIDIWGESMLYGVIKSIVPILSYSSLNVEKDFVYGFSLVKQALENEDHDLQSTIETFPAYMERWRDFGIFSYTSRITGKTYSAPYSENMRIVLIGHGFNGGIAKINGARFNMPVISFSAPGVSLIEKRFDLNDNSYQTVNIVPEVDVVPDIDRQEGVIQHIRCKEDSAEKCHHMKTTLCEIMDQCGKRDRTYPFCP